MSALYLSDNGREGGGTLQTNYLSLAEKQDMIVLRIQFVVPWRQARLILLRSFEY